MILILIITGCLLPQATSGRGRMRGIVLEESSGDPLEGVTVKLYSTRGRSFHKPFPITGKDGKWKAFSIMGGNWYIDFTKPGYETKKITFYVDTRPGGKKPVIEILLRKMEGAALENNILKEIGKAAKLYNENKFRESLEEFSMILEKHSENEAIEIVYKFIGNCYAGLQDYPAAIAAYEKALNRFPQDTELIICIGNAYMNSGLQEEALGYFKKIPFDKIVNVDTLYNIGIIHYNKGDYLEAVKYLKKAVEINNEFAEGFFRLGMTYTALNRIKDAVQALKKFMGLAPQSPDYQTAKAITDAFSNHLH